jgi:hypothetical protein
MPPILSALEHWSGDTVTGIVDELPPYLYPYLYLYEYL